MRLAKKAGEKIGLAARLLVPALLAVAPAGGTPPTEPPGGEVGRTRTLVVILDAVPFDTT